MMKRFVTYSAALLIGCAAASAATPTHALYVKDGDGVQRYSFGVAGDLNFSNDGTSLWVSGYESAIDLNKTEYITFDMPTDGQMTPTQQKDRIITIGEELNSLINVKADEDLLGFLREWSNLDYIDQEPIFAKFKAAHPDLFEENDDDYYAAFGKVIKAAAAIGQGKFAAARSLGKVYSEVLRSSDLLGGVFETDMTNETWVKVAEDPNHLVLRFKGIKSGKNYELVISASETYTTWKENIEVKEEDGSKSTWNVTGLMPMTIRIGLSVDSRMAFESNFYSKLNQDAQAINVDLYAKTDNTLVQEYIDIYNTKASESMIVTFGNTRAVTSSVEFTGSQLLNIQDWFDAAQGIEDVYESSNYKEYYYDVDGERICRKFGNATITTDILGKLQVKAHAHNYDKLYSQIDEYVENNDDAWSVERNDAKNTIKETYGSALWMGKITDVMNMYTDASFYYDNKPQAQGFIEWKAYEDVDDYEDYSNGYWDQNTGEWVELPGVYKMIESEYIQMPYLTFSDGSSFALDSEYFTGGNFSKLTNDAEDIFDTINSILSKYEYEGR